MGTKADFYVGRGLDAEWIGSIRSDGFPEAIDGDILDPEHEEGYRESVGNMLENREDSHDPNEGWPWGWESGTQTEYAYAFDSDKVWICRYGSPWVLADDYFNWEGDNSEEDMLPDVEYDPFREANGPPAVLPGAEYESDDNYLNTMG